MRKNLDHWLCRFALYRALTQLQRREDIAKQVSDILAGPHTLIIDTETTGLGQWDEVVEICIISPSELVVMDELLYHTMEMHPKAQEAHQIPVELLRGAPPITSFPGLPRLLESCTSVFYNAAFDTRLINQSLKKWQRQPVKFNSICIMNLFAQYNGEWDEKRQTWKRKKLIDAASGLGIVPTGSAHRARADALTLLQVIHRMAEMTPIGEIPDRARAET